MIYGSNIAPVPKVKGWSFILFLVCIPATSGWTEEIVLRDVRSVAAAVDLLQRRFHVPITYEDPPYLFEGDLEDITTKVARPEAVVAALERGTPLIIRGMKERELRFEAGPGPTAQGVEVALSNMLNANNGSDRPPAIFGLKQMDGRYHVYPTRIKTTTGRYVSHRSVMDVRMSLEPERRDCLEFWRDFCTALSRAANLIIVPGLGMVSSGGNCRTTIGGKDLMARQILLDFLAEREASLSAWGKFSWALLADANTPAQFALNPVAVPLAPAGPPSDSEGIDRLKVNPAVKQNAGVDSWDGGAAALRIP